MSNSKKQIRAAFRDSVYKRDKYTCRACGRKFSIDTAEENLDAHHVTPRELMTGGGYVRENGISLCKFGVDGNPSCHEKAEAYLHGDLIEGFAPEELYRKIGSSYELAVKASEKLAK